MSGRSEEGKIQGRGPSFRACEMTSQERIAVLRSRARALAREPDREGSDGGSTEVLSFFLAHEIYGIETTFIREVCPLREMTSLPCTPDHILGVINMRGQILTIVDIKRFLNLSDKGITNLNRVIIVQNAAMELGILASQIIGIVRVPPGELHPPIPTAISGAVPCLKGISSDGLILLDMERLLNDRQLIVHEEVSS